VLAGALVITAVVDLVEGRIPLVGEAQHIPELLSVVLMWLLAVPAPKRASASVCAPRTPLSAVHGEESDAA